MVHELMAGALLQVVALDLDSHLHPILGLGAMHLSQRRCCQRLVVELGEEFAWATQETERECRLRT